MVMASTGLVKGGTRRLNQKNRETTRQEFCLVTAQTLITASPAHVNHHLISSIENNVQKLFEGRRRGIARYLTASEESLPVTASSSNSPRSTL